MINQTLMQGLKEKDMQELLTLMHWKPFYSQHFFPLKENMTLSWKTLGSNCWSLKLPETLFQEDLQSQRKSS